MWKKKRPQHLLDKAILLKDEGQTEAAIELYREIIIAAPDWATPYYNLGLLFKYRCDWQESFFYNRKATELDRKGEAGWWNLGIAATALQDWRTARKAWNFFKMNLPVNNEELNMNLGQTPIRLNPDGNAEVVWCKRIDPARAIIENIPWPESNHRYQDLILNDGAPVGYRMSGGHEYPVFNELQLLKPSDYKTFSVMVDTLDQQLLDKLQSLCDNENLGYENWATVRMLCRQCSEGRPHEEHDHDLMVPDEGPRRIGLAAFQQADAEKVLLQWNKLTDVAYNHLVLELG